LRRAVVAAVVALAAGRALAEMPVFPEFALPHRYGRVVLQRASAAAGMAPVAFDHWRHRLIFTCRLCHVDVGFAMQAGATQVSAETNRRGLHCGACHDGKRQYMGRPIVAACSDAPERPPARACARCHGRHLRDDGADEYEAFARSLPRGGGGLVAWEAAERYAFTKPLDFLEGVSIRPDRLRIDRDFSIGAFGTWLGDIAFSHQKHARWSGCEGCHPELFPSTVRGATSYRMKDLVAGAYCGACHNKVAFPFAECRGCHRTARGGSGR
jgi:c(7)-type cytochrome triheme protein